MKGFSVRIVLCVILAAPIFVFAQQNRANITIQSGKELISEYLEYRESVWRLHPPPSGSQFVTDEERSDTQSWFEQSWSKWLATPTWFSSFAKSPDSLSNRIQDILWAEGDTRPVRVWEHPGKGEVFLGRIGEDGQTEVFARWPAPKWQPQEGESPEAFYNREVGTRRVSWTFASPHAPAVQAVNPVSPPGFALMMQTSGLTVTWTEVQTPQAMGLQVDLSTATEAGPFAVWKNTMGIIPGPGNGWEDLSGDWRPIAWSRERPEESEWTGTVDASGEGQLYLRASLGIIDSDADGLDDGFEYWYFGDLDETAGDDFDEDGFTNLQEFTILSNPAVADSDVDGRKDGDEALYGTDPTWPDHPDTELTAQGVLLP